MRSDSSDSNINIKGIVEKQNNNNNNKNRNKKSDDYDSDFASFKDNQSNKLKTDSSSTRKNSDKDLNRTKTIEKRNMTKHLNSVSSSSSISRSNSPANHRRNKSFSPVNKNRQRSIETTKMKRNSDVGKTKSYSSKSRSRSRTRSRSRSHSVSSSRSRSRSETTYNVKTNANAKPKSLGEKKKPPSLFNKTYKQPVTKYGTKPNKIESSSASNSLLNGRKNFTSSNLSKNSSESYPARPGQQRQNNKLQQRSEAESFSKTTMRLMSAQRLKYNELQNRVAELNIEIEKLKDENKILKRVHHREEIAIKRLESQDNDVTRIIKNHMDEANALKESLKSVKTENRKLASNLMDKDEELRTYKKKNEDLKKIINDKKLLESVELAKKLENSERDMNMYKTKCETLERKVEMMEKNHKHEIGVEIAHHKETQKNYLRLNEEFRELKVKFEEKERALDIANIYCRSNREPKDSTRDLNVPLWKASTQSLNAVETTPREKRKQYEKKRKDQKQMKAINDDTITETVSNSKSNNTPLSTRESRDSELERQREDAARKQQEIENQIKQQEAELKKKDAAERAKRQQKEMEEEMRKKKLKEEEEIRRRKQKEEDEREAAKAAEIELKKQKEKEALEEEERKKRWVSENSLKLQETDSSNSSERSKKDDLLAKLSLLDNKNSISKIESPVKEKENQNSLMTTSTFTTATLPPKPSLNQQNNVNGITPNSEYKFSNTIENLHDGRPANASRETNKNELLNKLFGNSPNNADFSIPTNKPIQQSKLDKADDIFSPKSSLNNNNNNNNNNTSKQQSTKVNVLPWEIDDMSFNSTNQSKPPVASFGGNNKTNSNNFNNNNNNATEHFDFFSKLNSNQSNTTSNTTNNSNGVINRPKLDNKLIFSSNHHKNNNAFVEDIEELTL